MSATHTGQWYRIESELSLWLHHLYQICFALVTDLALVFFPPMLTGLAVMT